MRNWGLYISAIALVTMTAAPASADFLENLKKDWDAVTGKVKGAIEDVTEGKEDVEEITEDAETLQEEFTGVGSDEPRYDAPWVTEFQQRLTALGLNPGPVDGAFGKKTANAIVIFQKVSELSPDGKPRPSVMRALRAKTQNIQTAQQAEPATTQAAPATSTTQNPQNQAGTVAGIVTSGIASQSISSGSSGDPLANVLAPAGIAIGMEADEAKAVLLASGYEEARPCWQYLRTEGKRAIIITITRTKDQGKYCTGLVNSIEIRDQYYPGQRTAVDIVNQINEQYGTQPQCLSLKTDHAVCTWRDVPNLPAMNSAKAQIDKWNINLRMEGVADLEQNETQTSVAAAAAATPAQEQASTTAAAVPAADQAGARLPHILAPAGIEIGMDADEAKAVLLASGFEKKSPCVYVKNTRDWITQTTVGLTAGEGYAKCVGPLREISYQGYGSPIEFTAIKTIGAINGQVGADPECSVLKKDEAWCSWNDIPGTPLIEFVNVILDRLVMRLRLKAVEGFEGQLTSAPAPAVAAPAPLAAATTIAQTADLLADGGAADGLVICSPIAIIPFSEKIAAKIFPGNQPALEDLHALLESLNMDKNLVDARVSDRTAELPRAVQFMPVAFQDKGVVAHPDGREFGEVGSGLGMDAAAKHCKLVLKWTKSDAAISIAPGADIATVDDAAGQSGASSREAAFERDLDFLQPAGVSIGMPVAQAESILTAQGFRLVTVGSANGGSLYKLETDSGSLLVRIFRDPSTMEQMPPFGAIKSIYYTLASIDPMGTPQEIADRMTRRFGMQAVCDIMNDQLADCSWDWPANEPLAQSVSMTLQPRAGIELRVRLEGVRDLAAKLAAGDAATAQEPGTDESHWIAPEGITIGTAIWQAEAILKEKGYRGSNCQYTFNRDDGGYMHFKLDTMTAPACQSEDPIVMLNYQEDDFKATDSIVGLVQDMARHLGAEGKCDRFTEKNVRCRWKNPPGAPLIHEVYLSGSKSDVRLSLLAIPNLKAHLSLPPPPAATEEEKPWWEAEVEKEEQEASATQIVYSGETDSLAPEVRSQISSDGRKVYDRCRERTLFAQLHDCWCVAQRFMDKRAELAAEAPWHQPENITGMADEVAGECPASEARIARHGYEMCVQNYSWKLPDDNGKAFCTCYGERFASYYLEDARSSFPAMGNKGAAALHTCSQGISPHPL